MDEEMIPKMYLGSPNRNRNNKDWFSVNRDLDDNSARGDEKDPVDIQKDKESVKEIDEI